MPCQVQPISWLASQSFLNLDIGNGRSKEIVCLFSTVMGKGGLNGSEMGALSRSLHGVRP